MKPITIAEATIAFLPAPARTPRFQGIDVVYAHVVLTLGRRGLRLTATIMGESAQWEATGWRALWLFERIANQSTHAKPAGFLEPAGLRKAA